MLRKIIRAKLHRATVTQANPDYVGSITIDRDLMEAVDLMAGECVLVADINNANRFETYVFEGERGSGVMCVNGAAAGLVSVGDKIIIMAFGYEQDEKASSVRPRIAIIGEGNTVAETL